MGIEAISSAASIALASTLLILLALRTWRLISIPFTGGRSFSNSIMVEAAQRFREKADQLRRAQSRSITLVFIFVVSFTIALLLGTEELLGTPALWQAVLVLLLAVAGVGYGVYRLVCLMIERRKVAYVRDANIAVGHTLSRLGENKNRVFHEVKVPAGVIDNVVAGLHGVYAIDVIALKPGKNKTVSLDGDQLRFDGGRQPVSIISSGAKIRQLGKALARVVGHPVRVRPVIAVPGWDIDTQASEHFLLVNERNVSMLRGWKDERDYLMNEDVEAIHAYLTSGGK